ncbi:hypothetical protein ACVDG3_18170 [Meridianimarinicoccus sp. RP-17]|uniref:hypothetical protein n=1 Tax=Meridianimarinicoccus zhengii TaxID=2056810 RepID=UPI0013A6E388|nr:hypothetical protein [Phycocomes zhengii]
MARERLSTEEAALINAVGAVAARLPEWDNVLIETMRIVIADVLPECDRDHGHLGPVCTAGDAILDWPRMTPQDRAFAAHHIRAAAAGILTWRAACAHDRRRARAGNAA